MRVMAVATKNPSPAYEAWPLLWQFMLENRRRFLTSVAELDLTPPQAFALRHMDPDRPVTMSELAEILFCDASNVTGLVDRLETRGVVERRPAPNDRRGEEGGLLPRRAPPPAPPPPPHNQPP